MFYIIGVTITFFLAVILLTKKNKSKADLVLLFWLICIGINLAFYYAFIEQIIYKYPVLLGFQFPLPLLQGAFLFLYTCALTEENFTFKGKWIHLIPFILINLLFLKFYLLPSSVKIEVFKNSGKGYELTTGINYMAIIVTGLGYIILSLLKLRYYSKNIVNEFSYTERINLKWLRYLILGILAIWVVIIFGNNDDYIFSTAVLFVIFLGFFGIKQEGLFNNRINIEPIVVGANLSDMEDSLSGNELGKHILKELDAAEKPEKAKYEKSTLNDEKALVIHQKLKQAMLDEGLYKNADLTLNQLASHINIHPNTLSQVINTFENKTFYDYINELRVIEFKNQVVLDKNRKFTLLSIALECGFNSKTSFNRNFKKVMGITPTNYLKQNHITLGE